MSIRVLAALLAAAIFSPAHAAMRADSCPVGVLLTVSGKINRFTHPELKEYRFGDAEFARLPTSTLRTGTLWTSASDWTGPTLQSVLQATGVDASATVVRPHALNDYFLTIPLADLAEYGPVVAHTRDGKRLKPEKFGPLFLMFPRDQHDDLRSPAGTSKFVWGLCRLEVR